MEHTIDVDNKLICTVWTGEAADDEFIAALIKYQKEIKNQPEYMHFNEILDLSGISSFNLTTNGLRRLSEIAAKLDSEGVRTRLAIVATQAFGYGLARMYQTFRSFLPNASKEVQVFRSNFEALEWVGEGQGMEEE